MPSRSLSFDEGDARVSKIKRTAVTTYRRFTGQVLGGEGGGGTASFVEGTQDDAVSNGTALSRSQTIVRDAEGTERVTEIVVEDTDWDKLQGAIYDPAHLDERAIDADSDSDGRLSRTGLSSEGWPNTLRLTGDALKRFIWPTFPNPQHEALFRKESYLAKKGAAMGMSLYFCLNWVLYLGINFGQHTFDTGTLFSKICYVCFPLYRFLKNIVRYSLDINGLLCSTGLLHFSHSPYPCSSPTTCLLGAIFGSNCTSLEVHGSLDISKSFRPVCAVFGWIIATATRKIFSQ